jgi:hypothetical protein
MSLSKLQISTLGCILDVLQVEHPDFDELTSEQNQALIECFNSLVNEKGKGKGGKSKEKSKEKSDNPKPGNSWITWLKENRETIKKQNGGKEEGLPELLSNAYNAFKKTPAFNALKNDCDEKMKEYKEKSNASDDEPKKKTKKVEKSSEEKKPLNVYMTYCKEHLDDIKAYASESGKSFNEAKQEMYTKFKKTKEFKTLEAKCKADLKNWNEKAPKKQAAASESDSDEVVVAPKPVAPKPVVQKPKTKKKEVVSSESESVPVKKDKKKADEPEPDAKKAKKDKKKADEPETKKEKKKADEPEVKKADKKVKKDKKKQVEVPPEDDEPVEVPPEDDEPVEMPPEDDEPVEVPPEDDEPSDD